MPDKSETITHIELDKLIPFKDHPFAVRELLLHKSNGEQILGKESANDEKRKEHNR